uniref:BTB domain-containing protein n=1 Tax=Setaria digitata TaxID=48799 RepID=A0A915PLU5_9BILA
MEESTTELIPLRGSLRLISKDVNDPVTLYAQNTTNNGVQAHLAKPAAIMQQQNKWSGGTIQFHKGDNRIETINTSLACAHSIYIRELINKTGVQSPILNCTALPFHWHTVKAAVQFMRTGSLQFDSTAMQDMIQCAIFFRIAQLSRLVESFLRQRSKKPETALDAYKAIFHDEEMMHCVTYDTQQIVCENMANHLSPYIEEAIRNERSTLALMTSNELYWLLARDAQRIRLNQREYEDAACQRFQIIMRWIQFQEQSYQIYDSYLRDVQSTSFAKAIRLFSCVHFEHMRPEIRRYFINYLRNVSFPRASTFCQDHVVMRSPNSRHV